MTEQQQTSNIMFRLACENDIPDILMLQNTVMEDSKRVVIYPRQMRLHAIEQQVKQKCLFIAVDQNLNLVIAQFKLCIVQDRTTQQDMLQDELKCVGQNRVAYEANQEHYNDIPNSTVYMYIGSAFVNSNYRGLNVMPKLETYAFQNSVGYTTQLFKQNSDLFKIVLCMGCVEENLKHLQYHLKQYERFIYCIKQDSGLSSTNTMKNFKYKTFMPKFSEENGIIQKLPNELCLPGIGYLLECSFAKHSDDK